VSGATYSWTGPNGFTSTLQNPTRSSAATADGGTYNVTVTVNGCTSAAGSTNVVVNATPATPTITGANTFCGLTGTTLTSSSASGNQWFLNGNAIGGATNQTFFVNVAGSYTVQVTASGCVSAMSAAKVMTDATPATPTITGANTFCGATGTTLTSSSASGNQWFLNGNAIGGATNQTFFVNVAGNYTVQVTAGGCASAMSATKTMTDATPATPTITAGGPLTFCAGGSVTLTSSSASGNQWFLNGNAIGGATNQSYSASVAGDYTVVVTTGGCASAASAAKTVTVNPNPSATITAPATVVAGSTGNSASVANAGAGATYNWSITNGTITAGTGTRIITFTAGASGSVTLNVTVTTSAGCSDAKSSNVPIGPSPVTVTSITPSRGTPHGGTPVTIAGTGFQAGATVTIGGVAATNVVVVSSTSITAKTGAHAPGAVNVTVTNTDTTTGTLTNGFTYGQQFDPNGDNVIDPADIFYLVNYIFTGGPAPAGAAGMLSGDANGDGVVDPADIFYAVNYIFTGGPDPAGLTPLTTSTRAPIAGTLTLGEPQLRGGRMFVPVIFTAAAGSDVPQALSISIRNAGAAQIHHAAGVETRFEISRRSGRALAYVAVFDDRAPLTLDANGSAVVAEIEMSVRRDMPDIALDPALTMLANRAGTQKASTANGRLQIP
jgi:hypothetical protein